MPTALFVSPHLDDVAFSCGGLVALLADRGWRTVLATVFTRSVPNPQGFALACQLDKGLPADVDYMALRRDEDARAAAILGVSALHWLDLPEAPHRGYASAKALFAARRADDQVVRDVAARLAALGAADPPDLVLAPQCLGDHVDHHVVGQAVAETFAPSLTASYRDTPYAMRCPPAPTSCQRIDIAAALPRKIEAACAYTTQVGFQFGGPDALARALTVFATREGNGQPAECFSGATLSWQAPPIQPSSTPFASE